MIFSRYNTPPKVQVSTAGDTVRTKQSFADEADINFIMRRYERTGFLVDPNAPAMRQAAFGNFAEGVDFLEGHLRLLAARDAFGSLPARVRERFHNDPGELIDFLVVPENRKEAEELGLVVKAAPEPPVVPAGPVG